MRTKEKILEKALILFAERGYENVSVEEIAAEVGIKAPSIYKHYKSKQDIFDAIIDKMKNNDVYKNITDTISSNNKFNDAGVFTGDLTQLITAIGFESFVELSGPTELTQFRKLMTVEQFNTPELAELFVKYDSVHCFEKFKNSKTVSGLMSGLKPAVIGLIGSAIVSIGTTVFFPSGFATAVFATIPFYVSLAIFAISIILAFKKIHPILIICFSAALGIATGYLL